jgi:HEPN domain-containing protein
MPVDFALVEETRAWIQAAASDLRSAEILLQDDTYLAPQSAFHTQQAAEKCFKEFLTWNSKAFRKTHNLVRLGKACVKLDPTLNPIAARVARISGWAVETRYPGESNHPSLAEVEEAIRLVRELYSVVVARLPNEVKP